MLSCPKISGRNNRYLKGEREKKKSCTESESLDRSIEEVGSPEHVFYLTLFTLIIHQQQSYCATVGLAGSVREGCF